MAKRKSYDVFICHASEDKTSFVEPLAFELRRRGLEVWFDKFELKVGSSLRESIERGLATSRFGVVVFSPSFFKKKWPKKELNGLFSRELSGNKTRILPILHQTVIREIQKRFPIQSDRICLFSSMPLKELCDKLIEVIKPELSETEGLKNRAFEVSDALIELASKQYPGYAFDISNSSSSALGKPNVRTIGIRIDDPSAIKIKPIVNIKFTAEGSRKADEFVRTGRPQIWKTGEFLSVRSAMPFFAEMTQGNISVTTPPDIEGRPVSLACGNAFFPYMIRRRVRGGTEEVEHTVSSDTEPIKLSLVWSLTEETLELTLSWLIKGFGAQKVLALLNFLDEVAKGIPMVISDLRRELPDMTLPLQGASNLSSPFDEESRRLIQLCARIEKEFNVKIPMTMSTTEDDRETLVILDSLLNGTQVDATLTYSALIRKGENPAGDQIVLNPESSTLSYFAPVDNYKGFLPLFGIKIQTPLWGIGSDSPPNISAEEIEAFRAAAVGTEVRVRVSNNGKGRYRWASEFPARKSEQ